MQYTDKNDSTLVELTLLGEESAYEELVLRHERAVMGTAYKVTNNTHAAEDASQDAFVSAWMNLSSLRDGAKFGAWVCSIAKNCAKTLSAHYRSAIPDLSLDILQNIDRSDGDSEDLPAVADYADLHAAVDALSAGIRDTVRLYYFEDLSVAEIAQRLSIPVGTVKWRLSEGRKQLRKGFGTMEKTYNENESLLTRVMRQVEELKLWRLKNDKTGFEEDYRAVLHAVEGLGESTEKRSMLADTLLCGYWWLPGADNSETFVRVKEAALAGHNDEVMQTVAHLEHKNLRDAKKIDFMRNTQIPYYRDNNYPKTLAYVWFWLGREYIFIEDYDEAVRCFTQVMSLLPPTEVYHATAKAAIDGVTRVRDAKAEDTVFDADCRASGEVYRQIGDTLYFWIQPGFSMCDSKNGSLFWNLGVCDGVMLDKSMGVGDKKTSSDGKMTYTYRQNDGICDTPAGHFEHCSVIVCEGDFIGLTYSETWLAENVGIVRQIVTRYGNTDEWALAAYTYCGGDGLLPFAAGNRWEYARMTPATAVQSERKNVFEVTASENGTVTVASMIFVRNFGYFDTWEGRTLEARRQYVYRKDGRSWLRDVSPALTRAEKLAVTKRQKLHTAVANAVMRRIFATDPVINPAYTEKGRWNFFAPHRVTRKDGTVTINDNGKYSFEWKAMSDVGRGNAGYTVLYSFLYTLLQDAAGCLWSDEWTDGYAFAEKTVNGIPTKNFRVTGGETVTTPAGTFTDCRRISFEYGANSYFGGKSEYWFAPGVGIVKFAHPYGEGDCPVWQLTDYRGTGEGYLPTDDGLFRRYEPDALSDGWHGSAEFTFDEDETGTVMFKNAAGTQDRANYEKAGTPRRAISAFV